MPPCPEQHPRPQHPHAPSRHVHAGHPIRTGVGAGDGGATDGVRVDASGTTIGGCSGGLAAALTRAGLYSASPWSVFVGRLHPHIAVITARTTSLDMGPLDHGTMPTGWPQRLRRFDVLRGSGYDGVAHQSLPLVEFSRACMLRLRLAVLHGRRGWKDATRSDPAPPAMPRGRC